MSERMMTKEQALLERSDAECERRGVDKQGSLVENESQLDESVKSAKPAPGGKGADAKRRADAARVMRIMEAASHVAGVTVGYALETTSNSPDATTARAICGRLCRDRLRLSWQDIHEYVGIRDRQSLPRSLRKRKGEGAFLEKCEAAWKLAIRPGAIAAAGWEHRGDLDRAMAKIDRGLEDAIRERIRSTGDPTRPVPEAVGVFNCSSRSPDFQVSILSGPTAEDDLRVTCTLETPAEGIQAALRASLAALDYVADTADRLGWSESDTRDAFRPVFERLRQIDRRAAIGF